jgi:hypothetical protein
MGVFDFAVAAASAAADAIGGTTIGDGGPALRLGVVEFAL